MVNYAACYKLLLMVLGLALLFQQVRPSGPPIRPSNANQNGVSKPQARNNQTLPRGANMSAGADKKKQRDRSYTNVTAVSTAAPINGKVSVQLSRVIQQNQTELGEDRSFSNPSADRVEERVDCGNDTMQESGYPPPQRKHCKPGKLLTLLNNEFDPLWLSIEAPAVRIERPPVVASDPELIEKSDSLNFSPLIVFDTSGDSVHPAPALLNLIKFFLNRYATCQMEYVWEEMDVRFWPRYIKRGTCINEFSCSWPPGMKCKPSRTKTLKILRWICNQVIMDSNRIKRNSADNASVQQNTRNAQKKAKKRNPNNNKKTPKPMRQRKKDKRNAFVNDPDTTLEQDNLLCRWQPTTYTVIEKCSCNCSP